MPRRKDLPPEKHIHRKKHGQTSSLYLDYFRRKTGGRYQWVIYENKKKYAISKAWGWSEGASEPGGKDRI